MRHAEPSGHPALCSLVKRAIYPGSFDPVTNGHLDVLARAARLFDEVVIAVASNDQKQGLFSADERIELLRSVITLPNIIITRMDGLLVNFAREQEASAVV